MQVTKGLSGTSSPFDQLKQMQKKLQLESQKFEEKTPEDLSSTDKTPAQKDKKAKQEKSGAQTA